MRARIGVVLALALAAGCSGSNVASVDADAATDADARGDGPRVDTQPDVDAARPETAGDLTGDRDATGEAGPDADARPDGDAAEASPETGQDADASPSDTDGNTADGDAAPTDAPKTCTLAAPTLTPTSGPVTGTLTGASNNSVVSCELLTQTQGPDTRFRLKVDTAAVVEIQVESQADLFLALRLGCGEDGTEIACASRPLDQVPPPVFPGPGGPFFDGGFGAPPPFDAGSGGDGGVAVDAAADPSDGGQSALPTRGLRARLAPGTYTIVIDSFGVVQNAPFTLTTRVVPPADNSACDKPEVVDASASRRGKLDLAGAPTLGCSGTNRAALYYAVGVPSGQRLTARVQPLQVGDRGWTPRIEALSSCGGGACLAQGHTAAGSIQQLDWINNSTSWRLVTLAVSADSAVNGAQFDLTTTVTDLLATCSRPTPLKDGLSLFSQDISAAPSPGMQTCGPFSDHAYYYSATLLPQQTISVTSVGSATQSPFATPVAVSMRASCAVNSCLPANGNGNGGTSFQNASDQTVTVIVELSPSGNTFDPRFDLHVSMPLPPAGLIVTPQSGLETSESAQTATFTVVLRSPPTKSVTIPIASDTPAEGTASPASLVFDGTNWSQPQKVTVTGVDDQQNDGPRRYMIVTGAATSGDNRYSGMDAPDVEVRNFDNEPGLLLAGADTIVTSEAGSPVTFTVRLNGKPMDTVKVPLSSSAASEGTVSPAELTFSPSNWNVAQTVTVTGVDDATTDGVKPYSIVIGALVSTDAGYGGLNPPDLPANNRDDDFSPVGLKLLSNDSCGFPNRGGMALDGFGTLYVVLFCSSKLSVITSADGGATFTAPVLIPDSGDLGGDFALAGGPGGVAYLAYDVPGQGVMFTRTADSGLTWSQRKLVTPSSGNLRLSAGASTVIVAATSSNGTNAVVIRSVDAGRTFLSPRFMEAFAVDVTVMPDGQTVWLPELASDGRLHGSTDAGATLTNFGFVDLTFGPFAFGPRHLFQGAGSFVQSISLSDTTMTETIANTISSGQTFSLVVEPDETLTLLNLSSDSARTEAVRIVNKVAAAPKTVGPRADIAFGVPLSRKVMATILYTGGLPLFMSMAFP